jgi:hypothetical protein
MASLRLEDFASDAAKGFPPPADPVRARLHDGISVFNTERQARNKAHDFPFLGGFIATIALEDSAPMRVERTLRGSPGHHTLWGDPMDIRARVVSVVPV